MDRQPDSHPYPDKGQYQQQAHESYQSQFDDGKPAATGPTVISVTRRVALSLAAVFAILLLGVIGLSAGLGVSQRDLREKNNDLQAVQAALASASSALEALPNPTAPASAGSPSSTPSPSPVKSDVQCPRVNGTVYTASMGGKRFRRMCGVDYSGEGGAVDIGNEPTRSLDACIDACAAQADCTGAGWGVIPGDEGPLHACWMKTNLTNPHEATPDWGFALLLVDETEEGGEQEEGQETEEQE